MSSPILLVGAGHMGGALLKGWLRQKADPILVVEPKPSPELRALARRKAIALVASVGEIGRRRIPTCVIALKPQVLRHQAPLLEPLARAGTLMISVAAGIDTQLLFGAWGKKTRIVRAMPNTPGAIGHGITGLFAGPGATPEDKRRTENLLAALGDTLWVGDEEMIDAVTALSGSGPAYLFLMAEAMTEAGVAEGLPRTQAERFARATVAGAGALLARDRSPARVLREAVTSPGGTTEAALRVLMAKNGLAPLMKRAIGAARRRAKALRR